MRHLCIVYCVCIVYIYVIYLFIKQMCAKIHNSN